MDSVAATRMTVADAAEAIGKRVEIAATARQAIVVNVAPTGAVLIRSCAKKGGYLWVDAASLIRRADCDRLPEPEWLQQARASRRPPLVLFHVLYPYLGEPAADEWEPSSIALDPVTYRQFERSVREARTR